MVDFKVEFGKAVGGISAIRLLLNNFSKDASAVLQSDEASEEVKQMSKGALALSVMVRGEITSLLLSLQEAIVDGAPDHLKQAIGEVIDILQQK